MEQLKGRKIAHVYLDTDYGRDTLHLLDTQAAQYGFAVQHLAVQPPGLDQKATWLRVKVAQPDWVLLRTAGFSTTTALKEAALVGFAQDTRNWVPQRHSSSKVHLAGQPMHLLESLKNNRLFCCLANPFLDT